MVWKFNFIHASASFNTFDECIPLLASSLRQELMLSRRLAAVGNAGGSKVLSLLRFREIHSISSWPTALKGTEAT